MSKAVSNIIKAGTLGVVDLSPPKPGRAILSVPSAGAIPTRQAQQTQKAAAEIARTGRSSTIMTTPGAEIPSGAIQRKTLLGGY